MLSFQQASSNVIVTKHDYPKLHLIVIIRQLRLLITIAPLVLYIIVAVLVGFDFIQYKSDLPKYFRCR